MLWGVQQWCCQRARPAAPNLVAMRRDACCPPCAQHRAAGPGLHSAAFLRCGVSTTRAAPLGGKRSLCSRGCGLEEPCRKVWGSLLGAQASALPRFTGSCKDLLAVPGSGKKRKAVCRSRGTQGSSLGCAALGSPSSNPQPHCCGVRMWAQPSPDG